MERIIEKMEAMVAFKPEYHDYKIGRKWHRRQTNRMPRVALADMAKVVNEKLDGFTAEIKEGYCSGDSNISGTRLRSEGKGRTGTRIIIIDSNKDALGRFSMTANVVLDHNSAEPYRRNDEVAKWILNTMLAQSIAKGD